MNKVKPLHTALLAGVALAGWGGVIAFSFEPYPWFRPWTFTWEIGACFILGILARMLAFRIFKRVRIALDSAFYVAVTFVWGAVPAAWLILIIITADAVFRYFRGSGVLARGETSLTYAIAYLMQAGALPALVLLLLGAAFSVDRGQPYNDFHIILLLPIFSLSFLIVHYFLAGGAHWFQTAKSGPFLRGFFVRVVIAELTLVPLSLAMVLDYMHHGIGMFLLLGFTALLFNGIFRRAVITSEKLDERVDELATLNNVGRILASSLERRTLLQNIATECTRLVGNASRFLIGVYDAKHENVIFEFFDQTGENTGHAIIPRGAGLTGWIMQNKRPLLLADSESEYARYANNDEYRDPSFRSWLGVPLIIYDEVFGVVAVESEVVAAYSQEHVRVLSTIADQAAVALENARLYELATVDGLTGLFVRRYFDQRLQEEWHRSSRYDSEFTLGIFDLDGFKKLNDTYGHQAGDAVLRAAAAVVRHNMRGADLAGRYGGEEFSFILPRTSVADAMHLAERIRADIEALEVVTGNHRLRVTCSIGVAGFPESGSRDVAGLVASADEALYEAKRRGKNRIVVAKVAAASDERERRGSRPREETSP